MTTKRSHLFSYALAALAAALVVAAPATAAPIAVPAPAVPGVAGLPGPLAAPATPSPTMGVLKTSPDTAVEGAPFTISASGLAPGKTVQIVWSTANVNWLLDPRPDSVDYIGRQVTKLGVVLATTTTDANGAFTLPLRAPRDYGGIHDVYAVIDGVQVAKGGFLIERHMWITPKRGPVGTTITVHYSGLASALYDSGAAIYWDNRYTGVFTGNTTRGEATFRIRAAGPAGKHQIVSGPAITIDYLNAPQSPQPWQPMFNLSFTVTKDAGPPPNRVDMPANVQPTLDAKTTLGAAGVASSGSALAQLSSTHGTVLSSVELTARGLDPSSPVQLNWANVVGNRVNCTGTCWSLVSEPLAAATAAADGSLATRVTVPDTLGGWHVIQLVQNGQTKAQLPFFVNRSLVSVTPRRVKAGQPFTVHLKGLGWTQLDNTGAVTYDNGYVGYGCGFNSNGDVVLNLVATGGPGTHLIDVYPLLYTQNPPYLNAVYGMVPFLSYAQDAPGLALGYDLPAIRTSVTIVE